MAEEQKPRIPVVEDDLLALRALLTLLRKVDYPVEGASTLRQAIEKFYAYKPRCVILDLMLPDGEGTELLRLVRIRRWT